jgi:hypothetical protein
VLLIVNLWRQKETEMISIKWIASDDQLVPTTDVGINPTSIHACEVVTMVD